MNYVMEKVLSVGKKFSYEYDFGSTTSLKLKVISEREIEDADSSISLLARNEPPLITCSSCRKNRHVHMRTMGLHRRRMGLRGLCSRA